MTIRWTLVLALLALGTFAWAGGCNGDETPDDGPSGRVGDMATDDAAEDDHAHDEVPLGTVRIGEDLVELAQGHGVAAPGKELHLVVKLPYTDGGRTIVRAWIGTQDRTASLVSRAEYAPSHDDYDVHAEVPDPMPEGTKWWIEIEKPDGTKTVGSIPPR